MGVGVGWGFVKNLEGKFVEGDEIGYFLSLWIFNYISVVNTILRDKLMADLFL
jgi:hypothetical protein